MDVNQMFPSKYARGEELPPDGLRVTITAVQAERLRGPGGESDGFLLWIAGAKRGIILSAALAHSIADALGAPNTDNWTGRQVILYPEKMTVAGKPVTAIRAKAAQPQAKGTGDHD